MQFSHGSLEFMLSNATAVVGPVAVTALAACLRRAEEERGRRKKGRAFYHRERVPIGKVHATMGVRIFRRAFRMSLDSFWRLHNILLPHLHNASRAARDYQRKGGRGGGNYLPPPIPNGHIFPSIRLGAALRYFAGGSPYDIVAVFGIGYSEVLSSVWIVVEAINQCPDFKMRYPDSLEEQRVIAAEFAAASTPGIRNCAGAVDGILIWMLKPSLKEATKSGVDQKKFLCGRKHKFGLNCQAVSDCRGRILDISMKCGGASADCLAFEASNLHRRLEEGLMKKDVGNNRFVLFGDNAYLNTSYMATPFTNVAGDPNRGAEDNYNFFHSQLRIRIECAFGMLVQRWGILRMAMPRNIGITRVVSLVTALAKLHNYCIGESNVPRVYDRDMMHIMNDESGYITLGRDNPLQDTPVPTALLHAGEHFDGMSRNDYRMRQQPSEGNELPRTILFQMIADGHWVRPVGNFR